MLPAINIAQEIYLAITISFRLSGKLFIMTSLLFFSSIPINIVDVEIVISKQLKENTVSPIGSIKENISGIIRYTNQIARKKNKSLYTS
ncbi:Uncharacterised protein [Streptococcus pneumoniae]|nr:Uncharacterised protein [Streptococcus pneumoniae]